MDVDMCVSESRSGMNTPRLHVFSDEDVYVPAELLMHILSFLSQDECLRESSLVCRFWYGLISSPYFWKRTALPYHLATEENLERVIDYATEFSSDYESTTGSKPVSIMQSLTIFGKMNGSSSARLTSLKPLSRCPMLQELSIGHSTVDHLRYLENCIYLKKLNISGSKVENLQPIVQHYIPHMRAVDSPGSSFSRVRSPEHIVDEDTDEGDSRTDVLTAFRQTEEETARLRQLHAANQFTLSFDPSVLTSTEVLNDPVPNVDMSVAATNLIAGSSSSMSFRRHHHRRYIPDDVVAQIPAAVVSSLHHRMSMDESHSVELEDVAQRFSSIQAHADMNGTMLNIEQLNAPPDSSSSSVPADKNIRYQNDMMRSDSSDDCSDSFSSISENEDEPDLCPLEELRLCMCVKLKNDGIEPLKYCVNLKFVDLAHTSISRIEVLSSCKFLEKVYLRNTAVQDVTPLSSCFNLRTIDIAGTAVVDISPLSACTNVVKFDLSSTRVQDISSIASMKGIRKLMLGGTRVENLSPLLHCHRLVKIDLSRTPCKDVDSLSQISSLRFIFASDAPFSDVSKLTQLPELAYLDIRGTEVDDIIHLVENSISLRMIDVTGSRVRRTSDRRPDLRVKGLDKLRWDDDETTFDSKLSNDAHTVLSSLRNLPWDIFLVSSLEKSERVSYGDWLAANLVYFYSRIISLYRIVHDRCTQDSCPQMMGSSHHEYLWSDGRTVKRPVRMSARGYINQLFEWVLSHLNDQRLMHHTNRPRFIDAAKYMFRRLFRVFAHIHYGHWHFLTASNSINEYNVLLEHYVRFCEAYHLMEDKSEYDPLSDLIGSFSIPGP